MKIKSFSKVTICMLLVVVVIASQASEAARFKNADKARADDREFLELCAQGSGQEIIKALKNGANPNARDQGGNSAADYILNLEGLKTACRPCFFS